MDKINAIYSKLNDNQKQHKRMKETLLSSFVFLTNFIFAYLMKYYLYAFLFFALFISSILFHIEDNKFTYYLDQICIYLVIGYGVYLFYKKFPTIPFYFSLLIIGSFLGTFFLFFWGRQTKSYCFDEDEKVSEVYHALLHLLSSVGHHLIIIA
jgi:hypothetical protein